MKVRHDKVVQALEVLCGIGNNPELLGDIISHCLEGALCDVTKGGKPVVHRIHFGCDLHSLISLCMKRHSRTHCPILFNTSCF